MSQFLLFRPVIAGQNFSFFVPIMTKMHQKTAISVGICKNFEMRPIRGSWHTQNVPILPLSISNRGSKFQFFLFPSSHQKMTKMYQKTATSVRISKNLEMRPIRESWHTQNVPILTLSTSFFVQGGGFCSRYRETAPDHHEVQNDPKFPKFRPTTYPRQLRHSQSLNSSSFDLQ